MITTPKPGCPFRPIVSSVNTYNYNLASYLVRILQPISTNQFTIKVIKESFRVFTVVVDWGRMRSFSKWCCRQLSFVQRNTTQIRGWTLCTVSLLNRSFPSSLVPLFQSESRCETILMKFAWKWQTSFPGPFPWLGRALKPGRRPWEPGCENETACRTHFRMKGFALRLVKKQKHKRTRRWRIAQWLFAKFAVCLKSAISVSRKIQYLVQCIATSSCKICNFL